MAPHDPTDILLQFDFETYVGIQDEEMPAAVTGGGDGDVGSESELEQLRIALRDLQSKYQESFLSEPSGSAARDDDAYQESYGHFSIHAEMLKDEVRTGAYRDAILKNPAMFVGRRVLDVGCGTGVLSMFAARAGAAHVTAVDFSDIAFNAMEIVRENGLENIVDVKHCKVEDLDISEPFDIVISEWMGYFLLFECMLSSVLYARDHYLKDDGIVLPDIFELKICGIGDPRLHRENVDFWTDVYGLSMTCMRKDVLKEAAIVNMDMYQLITDHVVVQRYDLNDRSPGSNGLEFVAEWTLTVQKDGNFYGWNGYFTTKFQKGLTQEVKFSTGPDALCTHWKQTVFLVPEPVPVKKGEKLSGKISVRKDRKDTRSLLVHFELRGTKHTFYIR